MMQIVKNVKFQSIHVQNAKMDFILVTINALPALDKAAKLVIF